MLSKNSIVLHLIIVMFSLKGTIGEDCINCNSKFTSRLLVNDFANIQVPNRQFVFPHVNFTCHAYITKWIFSGYIGGTPASRFDLPEIQIWQQRDKGYALQNSSGYNTIQKPISVTGNSNIVYVPNFHIPVQPGQILGLFVRGKYSTNSTQIYFFESSKLTFPYYYKIVPSTANLLTTLAPDSATLEHRYIPKLSLEISYPSSCTGTSVEKPQTLSIIDATITSIVDTTSFVDSSSAIKPTPTSTADTMLYARTSSVETISSIVNDIFTTQSTSTAITTSSSFAFKVISSFIDISYSTYVPSVIPSVSTSYSQIHVTIESSKNHLLSSSLTASLFITTSNNGAITVNSPFIISIMISGGIALATIILIKVAICLFVRRYIKNRSVEMDTTEPSFAEIHRSTAYVEHRPKPRPLYSGDSMYSNNAYMLQNIQALYNDDGPYYDIPIISPSNNVETPLRTGLNPAYKIMLSSSPSSDDTALILTRSLSSSYNTYTEPVECAPNVVPMQMNSAYRPGFSQT